jgi:ribosome biogenesis GTPase
VLAGDRTWRCQARGRLKKGRQASRTVAVAGDRVRLQVQDDTADPPTAVIEEVLPRRNRISRMSSRRTGGHIEQVLMANLDQVVVVQSVREPSPQTGFVDRLLMAAERFGVAGVLVLNKCELPGAAADAARWDYFAGLGYRVLHTSAKTRQGLAELGEILAGRMSLLVGASGVGKTSLLNLLEPGLGLRVGEITARTGLGRHTTTRTELFPLMGGGFIADSPGIRGFEPWDVEPGEVRDYFPDFGAPADDCRFRTCLHRDEPACGVKQAVAAGSIPAWRHAAYLALLKDLEERRERSGPGTRGRRP